MFSYSYAVGHRPTSDFSHLHAYAYKHESITVLVAT